MVTIVFAHPWHGSFNKVILDTVVKNLSDKNKDYQIIDLHKDKFNPVYEEEELALYSKGQFKDEIIGKYQSMIKNSDEIVFIFPIWWSDMPGILKGFFDKVFLKDFAFNYEGGWNPLLNIEKTTVITTSEQDTENLVNFSGDRINGLVKTILPSVGMKNGVWLNCEQTTHGTQEHRVEFLNSLKNI